MYDGGNQALLYRNRESAVMLNNIDEKAWKPLKAVKEALLVELDNDEVAREYMVPMRVVKSLDALVQDS